MSEPTLFKKGSMKNVKTPYRLIFRRYWVSLVGVSITWFVYDFITYVNYVSEFRILLTKDRVQISFWYLFVHGSRLYHRRDRFTLRRLRMEFRDQSVLYAWHPHWRVRG